MMLQKGTTNLNMKWEDIMFTTYVYVLDTLEYSSAVICPNSQSAALPSSEVPSPTDGPKDCKAGRDQRDCSNIFLCGKS